MRIPLPGPCLVVLVGASGSGKSSLARRHFAATEVVSSDRCRAMVDDDEDARDADADAFAVLHLITATRLRRGRLTVVDATNLHTGSRNTLLELARAHGRAAVALVLDLPEELCQERNRGRGDRVVPPQVVSAQLRLLHRGLGGLEREGFAQVVVLRDPTEIDAVAVERRTES
jgi:protein phosphatase